MPAHAAEHAFGCGNPVALASIEAGQTVLDIGSGAGIDVLLAAGKVGPQGRVIGLDMTPEMIDAARKNATEAGATNAEFRLGDAENMPVESGTVDWIISNCVINLAPDKDKVFSEAYRVLRPGGRLLVSDLVTHDLPEDARQSLEAWALCIGGALEEDAHLSTIRAAGFTELKIVARIDYDAESIRAIVEGAKAVPAELIQLAPSLAGKVSSIKYSAQSRNGREGNWVPRNRRALALWQRLVAPGPSYLPNLLEAKMFGGLIGTHVSPGPARPPVPARQAPCCSSPNDHRLPE